MNGERTALVTGGNRGLGLEISRQLAHAGARVILGSRDLEKGRAAAKEISGRGVVVEARQLDMANQDSIRECVVAVTSHYQRIDILVNNAGVMIDDESSDPIHELDVVRETMETNVYGPLLLAELVIPIMKTRRYGRIVNLSSGMGSLTRMGAGYVAYRMSKAGINVVTRVLAAETMGMGILINSVDPGWARTDMGGRGANRSVEKGAETPVWLSLLPDSGPTGGFFHDKTQIEW